MTDDKGGIAAPVTELIRKYQPQAILFQGPSTCRNLIRWVGNEDGRAPYPHWSTTDFTTSSLGLEEIMGLNGKPDGTIWCPGEADFPNRKNNAWNGGWLWHAGQDSFLFSSHDLADRYYTSVGRNANMLIGMAIDTSGLFPDADTKVFEEFGRLIRDRFKNKLASAQGKGNEILLPLKSAEKISQVVIMEDIASGEHIRKYQVDGLAKGGWIKLCEGISVGHKRIQQVNSPPVKALRLLITQSSGTPLVKEFAAYR